MTTLDLNFKTTPPQTKFLNLSSKYSAFIGGVGSGKTYAGAIKSVIKMMEFEEGSTGLVGAATYPMLRDVVISTLMDEVLDERLIEDYNKNEHKLELINDSTILFRPLETDRQIDRIRGLSIDWAWIDEAAYLPRYAFEVILGRLRGKRQETKRECWITTTPKGFNWVYDYFVNDPDQKYDAIHGVTSETNKFLDKSYFEDLRRRYTDEYLKQELHGQFVKFEGLVYRNFREEQHVIEHQDYDVERCIYGYDAGMTNPRVFLKIAVTPNDEYIIEEEYYRSNWLLSDAVDEFKEKMYEGGPIYADPSAKADIEEMKSSGIKAKSGDNDVDGGISKVQSMISDDRLRVHRNCQNIINEFHSYRWDENKDQPIKEMDHALDALRYALFTDRQKSDGGVESADLGMGPSKAKYNNNRRTSARGRRY